MGTDPFSGLRRQPLGVSSQVPEGYRLLHAQIANFGELLETKIQQEKNNGIRSEHLEERLLIQKISHWSKKTADAISLDRDAGTNPIRIATPDIILPLETVFPFIHLEIDGLGNYGAKFLQRLQQTLPVGVSWVGHGFYDSASQLQLISQNGSRYTLVPESVEPIAAAAMMGCRPLLDCIEERAGKNTRQNLTRGIERAVADFLQKSSNGNLVVHHFGSRLDFAAYYSHIPVPRGYLPIEKQLAEGLEIPAGQKGNVEVLVRTEKWESKEKRRPFHHLFGYDFENAKGGDSKTYYVFAGGQEQGFQNLRGIPGHIRDLQLHPRTAILVHSPGSRIDFTLAKRLLSEGRDNPLY